MLTVAQAKTYITEATEMNPGPWVDHSYVTAKAAQAIAQYHPNLDPQVSYVCGLLHDIGRRVGRTHMRHVIDGYNFLKEEGFEEVGRICLTHSFPYQDIRAVFGKWDCSEEEFKFVKQYLFAIEYNHYDKLIQLCDAIALPTGFCLMEKRMIDVALRLGTNDYTVAKWKATIKIKEDIEKEIGQSIYNLLPNVIENTFN